MHIIYFSWVFSTIHTQQTQRSFMKVLTDNQEHQQPYPSVPFNAVLDHSNPPGFLEYFFNFVSGHSDRSKSDSAEEKVVPLVHTVKGIAKKAQNAKAEGEAVEEKIMHKPNKSNGLDMENHSWGQNLHEVNATIPVPPGTKSGFVVCEMKKDHLKVGLKGEKPIIEGELFQALKLDECFWILEDNKAVSILMTKSEDKWWDSLFKGGPEIDTRKADLNPVNSLIGTLRVGQSWRRWFFIVGRSDWVFQLAMRLRFIKCLSNSWLKIQTLNSLEQSLCRWLSLDHLVGKRHVMHII